MRFLFPQQLYKFVFASCFSCKAVQFQVLYTTLSALNSLRNFISCSCCLAQVNTWRQTHLFFHSPLEPLRGIAGPQHSFSSNSLSSTQCSLLFYFVCHSFMLWIHILNKKNCNRGLQQCLSG